MLFRSWTYESAAKFEIPCLVSYGMNIYFCAVTGDLTKNLPIYKSYSGDEPFTLKSFPWVTITKNDFDPIFTDPEPKGPYFEFLLDSMTTTLKSYGVIVNSFYEVLCSLRCIWISIKDIIGTIERNCNWVGGIGSEFLVGCERKWMGSY